MKKINLEDIREYTREKMGTDAAYLAADYEGCSTTIDDAIMERADGETSIYYADIINYISDHVEEVANTINEFGWEGVGADLYNAGQMAEFESIRRSYEEKTENIIKYAAIMDLIYKRGLEEIDPEKWMAIKDRLTEEIDGSSRFDDITDIITEVLQDEEETETSNE